MIRSAEALDKLLAAAARRPALEAEDAPAGEALGRVMAEAVRASEALPRFDNSSMDGFAVAAARTARASKRHPVELPVAGTVAAGDAPACTPRPGFAWEIMTGGPIPAGCDAVVRVEDVERSDGGVVVRAPAEAGDYVRRRGADLPKGSVVVPAGAVLTPGAVLAIAAAGVDRVRLRRRPRVAVIPTGRELVAPGRCAGPGQVHDSSSAFLRVALPLVGAQARVFEPVSDDPAAFGRALAEAREDGPDLILTTGAVSKGRYDFVTEALAAVGARTVFHGVAIRPGKPILCAELGDGPLAIGLPGNPVSTVVGLRFFAVPFLRRLLDQPEERPLPVRLGEPVAKPEGLRCFFKARLEAEGGELRVRATAGQASFQVSPLVEANGWVVLPEAGTRVRAGATAAVFPWLPRDADYPAPVQARARRTAPSRARA
ncbi:MAG: molybdopterin molybdotransferase MoeA [Elusimicrobia bacterium]|nr:molybdopterin molybdotransferase MoeA [Elusimicrobiota bacterium]